MQSILVFPLLLIVQHSRKGTSHFGKENSEGYPVQKPTSVGSGYHEDMMVVESIDDEASDMYGNKNIKGLQIDDEASDLYLM